MATRNGQAAGPTHEHCPDSGQPADAAGSTHHLVPRRAGNRSQRLECSYCGRTYDELRDRVTVRTR